MIEVKGDAIAKNVEQNILSYVKQLRSEIKLAKLN